MYGNPALLRSSLDEAVATVRKSKGLPTMLQKKRHLSCHRSPSLSRSAFWTALWVFSASRVCSVSLMLRPLPFFGAVKAGTLLG
jgi:hypothetical protein